MQYKVVCVRVSQENGAKGTERVKEFSVWGVGGGKEKLRTVSRKMFLLKGRSVLPWDSPG